MAASTTLTTDPSRFITGREFRLAMEWVSGVWGPDQANAAIAQHLAKESHVLAPDEIDGSHGPFRWQSYTSFWPPRLLNAYRDVKLIAFFGAGLSIPSGLSSWSGLLTNYFALNSAFLEDGELKNDPLTLAELASHQIGSEQLQSVLRQSMENVSRPAVSHAAAAALRLPFYITTNYDDLFERAFAKVNHGVIDLDVIANSSDLARVERDNPGLLPRAGYSYLIKIHGCISRRDEHLILTRSDYRRHYRFNKEFFDKISQLVMNYHVLFLGFSHSDPEVSRLVEDVIWKSEGSQGRGSNAHRAQLNLYSLQYGMSNHMPEVFAAKGIVALRPSLPANLSDVRTGAVSRSLADLAWAAQTYDGSNDLDWLLADSEKKLSGALRAALARLGKWHDRALSAVAPGAKDFAWMKEAQQEQAGVCGQGLYLVSANGAPIHLEVPEGLDPTIRSLRRSFADRPYFRQAQTFRRPFVSDSVPSTYNNNSTFMFCIPLVDDQVVFRGLLFGACQIGAWDLPIKLGQKAWDAGNSFLLIDSNGICLIPPKNEFLPISARSATEKSENNVGYVYQDLLSLSRRDRLVARVMENVVPLDRDDDVLALASDFAAYSVVTEIKDARWKLAISSAIQLSKS